jgi:hypothetical protein
MQSLFTLGALINISLNSQHKQKMFSIQLMINFQKFVRSEGSQKQNKVQAEDRELIKVVVALPAKAELRKKIYIKLVFK